MGRRPNDLDSVPCCRDVSKARSGTRAADRQQAEAGPTKAVHPLPLRRRLDVGSTADSGPSRCHAEPPHHQAPPPGF